VGKAKVKAKDKTSQVEEDLKGAVLKDSGKSQGVDEGASIEQIRDILFGAQIRDFEKRFARVEQRLIKEITSLKDESRKRFDSLESYIGKEVESLSDRLKAEQDKRTESVKELSGQLKDTNKLLEKRAGKLDDQLGKSSRELRQQILEQYKNLSDEIQQKHEETSVMLEQLAQELRAEKVDLATLSELFAEIALRLNDNLASKLKQELGSLGNE
jgi:DNA repair exonuclease SbcCD ATPase subunit